MANKILIYSCMPVIAALIGWLTNRIAVKMIFRPRRPIRILGLTVQGLIPKRRAELARTIGETVERELISHRDIRQAVSEPSFLKDIGAILRERIDVYLRRNLGGGSLVGMLLSGEAASKMKDVFVDEVLSMLPETIESILYKLEDKLDFQKVVREKVESFELDKLENIVYRIAARELRAIEYLGGALGFLVGVMQVLILVLGDRYV